MFLFVQGRRAAKLNSTRQSTGSGTCRAVRLTIASRAAIESNMRETKSVLYEMLMIIRSL